MCRNAHVAGLKWVAINLKKNIFRICVLFGTIKGRGGGGREINSIWQMGKHYWPHVPPLSRKNVLKCLKKVYWRNSQNSSLLSHMTKFMNVPLEWKAISQISPLLKLLCSFYIYSTCNTSKYLRKIDLYERKPNFFREYYSFLNESNITYNFVGKKLG